jgi:hypothetical protein
MRQHLHDRNPLYVLIASETRPMPLFQDER